jgi:hypothetical protein
VQQFHACSQKFLNGCQVSVSVPCQPRITLPTIIKLVSYLFLLLTNHIYITVHYKTTNIIRINASFLLLLSKDFAKACPDLAIILWIESLGNSLSLDCSKMQVLEPHCSPLLSSRLARHFLVQSHNTPFTELEFNSFVFFRSN